MASLFNDPNLIRQQILANRRQAPGSTPESAIIAASGNLGSNLGYGIARLFGREFPQVQKEEAKQNALTQMETAIDPETGKPYAFGTGAYFLKVSEILQDNGFIREAHDVNTKARATLASEAAVASSVRAAELLEAQEERALTKEKRAVLEPMNKVELENAQKIFNSLSKNTNVVVGGNSGKTYLKGLDTDERDALIQDANLKSRVEGTSITQAMENIVREQLQEGRGPGNFLPTGLGGGSEYRGIPIDVSGSAFGARNLPTPDEDATKTTDSTATDTTQETQDSTTPINRFAPELTQPRQLSVYNEKEIDNLVSELSGATDIQSEIDTVGKGGKAQIQRGKLNREKNKAIEQFKNTMPEFKALENYKKQLRAQAKRKSGGRSASPTRTKALRDLMNTPKVKEKLKILQDDLVAAMNEILDPTQQQLFLQ